MFEKHLNCTGSMWSETCQGSTYRYQDRSYVLTSIGGVFVCNKDDHHYHTHHYTPVQDSQIISAIRNLELEDFQIRQARQVEAHRLAAEMGEALLATPIFYNMFFNDGAPDKPTFFQEQAPGIPFFQVGRNSSHQFYMGAKDGQRYRVSTGYDYTPEDGEIFCVNLSKTDDWSGYWGHH